MITELDVTLTDYGVAFESMLFALLMLKRNGESRPLRTWYVVFFTSVCVAALAGGTVHGFYGHMTSFGQSTLWLTALVALGVTALAAWVIGSHLQFSPALTERLTIFATVWWVAYCLILVFVTSTYWIAIANYLPAALFLLFAFGRAYRRQRTRHHAVGLIGMVLTFVAAGVQITEVSVHPIYFTHNALYHIIQALALLLIFLSALRVVETPNTHQEVTQPC